MLYNYSAKKDVGKVRSEQQDDLLVLPQLVDHLNVNDNGVNFDTGNGALFVVADGMGGGANGALASRLAVEGVREYFILNKDILVQDPLHLLKDAVFYANSKIREHLLEHQEDTGMGSTIVAGLVIGKALYLGWIGDSRCYVVDTEGRLIQLTKDHSYVQTLIDENKITPEQAFYHPKRNIITQSLGMETLEPSLEAIDLSDVSFLLFCSDGLTTMLSDHEIEKFLSQKSQIDLLNNNLINQANEAGGEDNISSVLVQLIRPQQNLSMQGEAVSAQMAPKGEVVLRNNRSVLFKLLVFFLLLIFVYAGIRFMTSVNVKGSYITEEEPASVGDNPEDYNASISEEHETGIPVEQRPVSADKYVIMSDSLSYYVRLNVFNEESRAEDMLQHLKITDPSKDVKVRRNNHGLYEVCVFGFSDKDEAVEYLRSRDGDGGVILYQN